MEPLQTEWVHRLAEEQQDWGRGPPHCRRGRRNQQEKEEQEKKRTGAIQELPWRLLKRLQRCKTIKNSGERAVDYSLIQLSAGRRNSNTNSYQSQKCRRWESPKKGLLTCHWKGTGESREYNEDGEAKVNP